MSGILGLIGEKNAGQRLYPALFAQQHRGQDAAGILSYDYSHARFYLEKARGLAGDIFSPSRLARLKGNMALGHTRYSLDEGATPEDLQPLFLSYPYGIGMVHDGNVTNYDEIADFLRQQKRRRPFSFNDLELLLHMMAVGLETRTDEDDLFRSLAESVRELQQKVQGAYSVVAMLADRGMFAFCDPHGIRPLLVGRRYKNKSQKWGYCFASERQVFQALGYEFLREMAPGEFIFVDRDLNFFSTVLEQATARPCMFEWVYLAGPETVWHGQSVYQVRLRLGEVLGRLCRKRGFEVDLVAPVPDTSRPAALRLAEVLGKPYREVLVKNRYVQRSFIAREDAHRKAMVGLKLSPIEAEIRGRRILLVDDSIVRGTTAMRIVQLLRDCGAAAIYLASTAPPVRHACYYGVDFPREESLLAYKYSEQDMARALGVDGLAFLPAEALQAAIGVPSVCMACINGDYPVPVDARRFLGSLRFVPEEPTP